MILNPILSGGGGGGAQTVVGTCTLEDTFGQTQSEPAGANNSGITFRLSSFSRAVPGTG